MNTNDGSNLTHMGPAPEPPAFDLLGDEDPGAVEDEVPFDQLIFPKPGEPAFETSPPPENPAAAAELEELRRQNGQLLNEMGSLRAQVAQVPMLSFQLQAILAAAQQSQGAPPPLDPNADPDAPLSRAEMAAMMAAQAAANEQQMTARMALAQVNPTQEEINTAFQLFPFLNMMQEPLRTSQLASAVTTLRQMKASAPAQAAAPSATPQVKQRPLEGRVAPLVERAAPSAGAAGNGSAPDALRQAYADYEAAKAKKDLPAMKRAMQRAAQAQGISPEQMFRSQWEQ